MSFNVKNVPVVLALVAALLFAGFSAQAEATPVGTFSYLTYIPGGEGNPGTTYFRVENLTGASAFPGEFPVTDALLFKNSLLTVTYNNESTAEFSLGAFGPGSAFSSEFVDTASFSRARFSAELELQGISWTLLSNNVYVDLLPRCGILKSGGGDGEDGDSTVIDVGMEGPEASPVPEPSSLLLLGAGLAGICGWKRSRGRKV